MPIPLDTQPTLPPVVGAREVGQHVTAMVVDKQMRGRQQNDGSPMINSTGRQSQEEVVTVIVMAPTTGTISHGDLEDPTIAEVGEVHRLIFKGRTYSGLIEARKKVGNMEVGDVIDVHASAATVWRGAGDVAATGVTDVAKIAAARQRGLSVGMDLDIGYRRATPAEATLVARAEQLHMDLRSGIALDPQPANGTPAPAATPAPPTGGGTATDDLW